MATVECNHLFSSWLDSLSITQHQPPPPPQQQQQQQCHQQTTNELRVVDEAAQGHIAWYTRSRKRSTPRKQHQKGNEQQQQLSDGVGDGSVSVTLTDPCVLDCPICFENLTIPVFQCENGHLACSSCCIKLGNKCPSCSCPIGSNRCRAIENVIESIKISCRNMKYGCKEIVTLSKIHDHMERCIYAPCSCPLPNCDFVGSSKNLFLHFNSKHPDSATRFCYDSLIPISLEKQQKYFILQEQEGGIIFILNNGVERLGNVINVSCIAPSSSRTGFLYDLVARKGGSSVRLQSFTEYVPGRLEHPSLKRFLLVPSDFVGSCGQLKLELCIWWKPPKSAGHI